MEVGAHHFHQLLSKLLYGEMQDFDTVCHLELKKVETIDSCSIRRSYW